MLSDDKIIEIYLKNKLRFQNPPALQAAVDAARAIEQAARAEALEDAAKVCLNVSEYRGDYGGVYGTATENCANAIRALINKEQAQ